MVSFNDYILEKLRISIDLMKKDKFEPGDNFLIISLYNMNNYKFFSDLKIISFENYDEDRYEIKYHSGNTDKDLTRILYINDKGYFQKDIKETSKLLDIRDTGIESLFLSRTQALDFLAKVNSNQPLNNLLKEYFDSKNERYIDYLTRITISDDDFNDIMNYLK